MAPEEGGEATASVSELWDQKHPISVEEETTREVRCPHPREHSCGPSSALSIAQVKKRKNFKSGGETKAGCEDPSL